MDMRPRDLPESLPDLDRAAQRASLSVGGPGSGWVGPSLQGPREQAGGSELSPGSVWLSSSDKRSK